MITGMSPQQELNHMANPNWLLSQMPVYLQQHMAYQCSVKWYGTVLYRYGGDLLHALNVSLKCNRSGSFCFGCKCHNLPDNSSPEVATSHAATAQSSSSESESEPESDDDSELERAVNDIMLDMFSDGDIQNDSNSSLL